MTAITVELNEDIAAELRRLAVAQERSETDIVCEALAAYVQTARPSLNGGGASSGGQKPDDWTKNFEAWMADVQSRRHRYPPGFVMDDSRESIYEGRGQ